MNQQLFRLTTNLVVADESRMEKTICLSVSLALKAWGIPGRPRLFEVCVAERHLGLDGTLHYDILQKTFMDALPADVIIYNEYHALIVALCKESCHKSCCGEICGKISDNADCH